MKVKNEKDIDCHGERPPWIGLHEPGRVSSERYHCRTHTHFEKKALRLTQCGRFANFETLKCNDARNARPNVGDAGEDDEGILDVARPGNERVSNEDEDDGKQANGSSYALHKHQSADLVLCKGFFLLHRDW